ncbi:malto-oligosyltrehalose synthase [Gordonia shandongensis]|uniref:malto-oligosyltrehalose synthase n=1 Tax=Gordonia shandongensis TaxID=376351 RepID=UPI0003F5597D|nr:malto-oligosyltrehalose synthase [Gordonia shandongensis]
MPGIPTDPVAVYRVQLTTEFAFAEVAGILEHLVDLGISHLYLSPILEAMPGSTHGYDWCPPGRIAPSLGGDDGFLLLREHARALGIGIIVDIVPNHVGVADADRNPWWFDVLVRGTDSAYAHFFDLAPSPDGVIALPWLGAADDIRAMTVDSANRLVLGDIRLPTAPGTCAPGDDPVEVHERQHYRLVAHDSRRIGYRRFLDINTLAALRQDLPEVYEATHAWLRDLVAADLVDGVRVDHLDGLRDPVGYLRRLRADLGDRLIYVEKGLGVDEPLDPALPVDGTTGYEQLRLIEASFTAPTGTIELDETYQFFSRVSGDGDQLLARARAAQQAVLVDDFPDRLQRVTEILAARAPEVRAHLIGQAVTRLICDPGSARPDYPARREHTRAHISALSVANPTMTAGFDVLARAFADPEYAPEAVARLGEAAVAVYARAIEGVGFHRTGRLVSSQERGCTPRVPAVNRGQFNECNADRVARWPRGLSALTTHDTLRSEDVRARIAVIAQTPQRWRILTAEVFRLAPPPDARFCYFLLQNVVGVWPDDGRVPDPSVGERLADYARAAMREGRTLSSWTAVDDDAEAGVQQWLAGLRGGPAAELIGDFVRLIAPAGRAESLSRKAICLLGPGVPDVYQGTQWWDDSLTDPDNRRPVDYSRSPDHPKTRLIRDALTARRRHPRAFGPGSDFVDVAVRGPSASHLIAFGRGTDGRVDVVVVAVRLALMVTDARGRATTQVVLPPGRWHDAARDRTHVESVAAETLAAEALTADGPVTILERID